MIRNENIKILKIDVNENDEIVGDKELVDLFLDIGAGICNAQKYAETIKPDSTFDMSKVRDYKPRTKIPDMIKEILEESNYRQSYEWHYDKSFTFDKIKIEVIRYDINTSDWCIVKIDGEEKKITKKGLRELWESKD